MHEIGNIITIRLKVEESDSCEECFFEGMCRGLEPSNNPFGSCLAEYREDGKDVIFREVKEEKEKEIVVDVTKASLTKVNADQYKLG